MNPQEIDTALKRIDEYARCFNARNAGGMDACLHFPHVLLMGTSIQVWEEQGSLTISYFDDMSRRGWHHSEFFEKIPIVCTPTKIHVQVRHTRNRMDGRVISTHEDLWILTCENGKWGIKVRSQ